MNSFATTFDMPEFPRAFFVMSFDIRSDEDKGGRAGRDIDATPHHALSRNQGGRACDNC